jgi:uncharacterized protein (TIGR00251 family)
VDVLVQPNASRAEVVGIHGDRLKVRVTVPPRRLAANAAVVDLLTSIVGVRRGEVVGGMTSRIKTIELVGADVATATKLLLGP